jgi:hypothetical protein
MPEFRFRHGAPRLAVLNACVTVVTQGESMNTRATGRVPPVAPDVAQRTMRNVARRLIPFFGASYMLKRIARVGLWIVGALAALCARGLVVMARTLPAGGESEVTS